MNRVTSSSIREWIRENQCTQLCVGPVSKNSTDAAIEIANECNIPIVLIASRRQIDSAEFGGGYVNRWTTGQFADYVRTRDRKGNVILARDHGGPWQSILEQEKKLSAEEAMQSAKRSYFADIDAGFSILHIDPSVDIHEQPSQEVVLQRVFELYRACSEYAREKGRSLQFEIGTEEQSGQLASVSEFSGLLSRVEAFCLDHDYEKPLFAVAQTGTRVMEMQNVGELQEITENGSDMESIREVVKGVAEQCEKHGIYLKAHNGDYLSELAISMHPQLGVHGLNVAPEFGVQESERLTELFRQYHLPEAEEAFLELSYESGKWKKWMLNGTAASDRDRSIISGHYVFATEKFAVLKDQLRHKMAGDQLDPDRVLTDHIKKSILRYVQGLNMVKH
ncbi:MAG: tagatose-6-phosphate kinase [Balneolaceae bacterium]|nr:MAG: tagatose-6-phosphate kinase [Balneolaceae bacterium]